MIINNIYNNNTKGTFYYYKINQTNMPMKKDITPDLCNDKDRKEGKVVAPSARTLNFIKQFARSYYVEQKLPMPLAGICVN